MPVVTTTTERLGERPVAKALGTSLFAMATRGFSMSAMAHTRSMTACSWGACSGVTTTARMADIAIESAGILLPSGNLEKLPELFDISRATIRTIRQNLTWALFYNLVSIPVAALGVLHPSICATAMSASSIGVLMHSLRLKDSGKKERRFPWKKKS